MTQGVPKEELARHVEILSTGGDVSDTESSEATGARSTPKDMFQGISGFGSSSSSHSVRSACPESRVKSQHVGLFFKRALCQDLLNKMRLFYKRRYKARYGRLYAVCAGHLLEEVTERERRLTPALFKTFSQHCVQSTPMNSPMSHEH